MKTANGCRWSTALVVLGALLWGAPGAMAVPCYNVGEGGDYTIARMDTNGAMLAEYGRFAEVGDVCVYDATTMLVSQPRRGRVLALTLDGDVAWELRLPAARFLRMTEAGRFLVCQSTLGRVVEVDRHRRQYWVYDKAGYPTGACRLPDGTMAVVEARQRSQLQLLTPAGATIWATSQHMQHPHELLCLPDGQLVTSGFDSQALAVVDPVKRSVRRFGKCPHAQSLDLTPDGELLVVSPEYQEILFSRSLRHFRHRFRTHYPPMHGAVLPDGSLLISLHYTPEPLLANGQRARRLAGASLPAYLQGLLAGGGLGLLLVVAVQGLAGWRGARSGVPEPVVAVAAAPAERRVERVLYALVFAGLVAWAAVNLQQTTQRTYGQLADYFALTALAGVVLAIGEYRGRPGREGWLNSLKTPVAMERTGWPMWLLWTAGAGCAAVTVAGVYAAPAAWQAATWSAGVVLLLGGSVDVRRWERWRVSWGETAAVALLVVLFAAVRLVRLADVPANVHLDMANWARHSLRILDGLQPTLWGNSWAEIPVAGYLWSVAWIAVGGRDLFGLRLPAAMAGVVSLVLVYYLVRRLAGRWAAFLALALVGLNHTLVHFSRITAYIDPLPFQLLGVLGLVYGMAAGRYGWFALAAAGAGYSALCYHAGRISPVLLVVLTVVLLLRHPRLVLRRWPGLVLALVLGLAVLGPQGALFLNGQAEPLGRGTMFGWAVDENITLWDTLAEGVPQVAGTCWLVPDSSSQYGIRYPVLTVLPGTLLAAGLVFALLRLWDTRWLLLVVWGVLILFVGGVLTIDPPFWPRMLGGFVPLLVLAGLVLGVWARQLAEAVPGGRWLAGAVCVVVLVLSAWQNAYVYGLYRQGIAPLGDRPQRDPQWVQTRLGRDLQQWGPGDMVYIVSSRPQFDGVNHPTIHLFAYDVNLRATRDITRYLPLDAAQRTVCYFYNDTRSQLQNMQKRYPQLQVREFHNDRGNTVLTRAVIPAQAPQAGGGES